MSWHKVRCWECGTVYGEQWCKHFMREYGRFNHCPRCGCDYLLGFANKDSEVRIR